MITETNIYDNLITHWLTDITIYKTKPHQSINDDWNYLYINRISNNVDVRSFDGIERNIYRFEFRIVCKKVLWTTESSIDILNWYIQDLIEIYDKSCIDEIWVSYFDSVSPILYDENDRPQIAVDFIFRK